MVFTMHEVSVLRSRVSRVGTAVVNQEKYTPSARHTLSPSHVSINMQTLGARGPKVNPLFALGAQATRAN